MMTSYRRWREIFENHLYDTRMPLITGEGVDPEDLLQRLYEMRISAQRAADEFNRRLVVAQQRAAEAATDESEAT